MGHLSEEDVARFLAGRLEPEAQKRVVRHLLTACSLCSRRIVGQAPDRLLRSTADSLHRGARSSPLDRALVAALRQEDRRRESQQKLARSLGSLRTARGDDGLSFRPVPDLQGVPLVEALLQQSFELRYRDPKAMRWIAYNALKAAESLSPAEYGQLFVCDLQARAWGDLANAYRINDEFAEAEMAFEQARALLRRGSGDLRLLARTADLEASLRKAQRRLAEAVELFDGAYRLYSNLGEEHLAGRALVSKGLSLDYDSSSGQAVQTLRKSLTLLDEDRDPQLASVARHNLIEALGNSGDFQAASRLLLQSGLRSYFAEDDHLSRLQIRWTEGRIQAGLGRHSTAESALLQVRGDYLDLGVNYAAALVGLDLLPIWFRQGKSGQARATAKAIYGTLAALGIHPEAARARRYLE